jgi:CheY-like chemotaxis protein
VFNARDASPAGGIITIRARNEPGSPDTVVIEIADDGTGIPPEIQAQVFEPFFTTKPVGQGTGLGLSQVRRFAEDSGGSVGLRSTPGQGTVVTLRLPRASGLPDVEEPVKDNRTLAGPCQLLFVEDDVLVGDVVTSALTGAGFGVVLARSGDEAILRLRGGERFDIVFSDVVMPGSVDGVQLAERLAAEFPGLPVVLASGYSERQPTAPNAVLLTKPYSIDLLVRTLVETLERRR